MLEKNCQIDNMLIAHKCSMTLHGTNLRSILLLPAERRLICHLLWQWRGTSLVVPLHLDNPHNAVPLVWCDS